MLAFGIWLIPVVVFVLYAVYLRPTKNSSVDSVSAAVAIHKEKLAALKLQREANELTEEEYQQLSLEVQRAILADTEQRVEQEGQSTSSSASWLAVPSLSLIVFAAALLLYQQLGDADGVRVQQQFQALSMSEELTDEQIETTLSNYQAYLKKDESDIEGWFRLSRMQMDMGDHQGAIDSLTVVLRELRAVERTAEDESTVLTYIGQSHLSLGNIDEALTYFLESLQFFAQNTTSLGLAGRIYYELGDYVQAIDYWTRLKVASRGSQSLDIVDDFINQAKLALAEQGIDYEAEQPTRVIVNVSLPAAWQGLPDEAALFVYARPVGVRMPIAATRVTINDQDVRVMLTDSDAMGPAGMLSDYAEVEITARVSANGTANTAPGDWIGDVVVVDLSDKQVDVDIQVSMP